MIHEQGNVANRKDLNIENDEVKTEGKEHGQKQPNVNPWGHDEQRLIFRQAVHGVQHLNCDQHRQSHGHWVRIMENAAVNSLEVFAIGCALQVVGL